MDTAEFLRSILPGGGTYIAVESGTRDGKSYNKHHEFHTIDEMADAILAFDARGKTVYHACNSFNDTPTDGHTTVRSKDNVRACRTLYDDVDIGPGKGYATRKEALTDIKRVAMELALMPMVVSSGNGIHLYWRLDGDISPAEWRRLATLKRTVLEHAGLKVDHAVDLDEARILRPVGAHNRKNGEMKPVEVRSAGRPYSASEMNGKLAGYMGSNGLTALPPTPSYVASALVSADDLGGGVEYPPSSGYVIARHCQTIGHIVALGGDVEEPLWRGMLGVAKHTVEGDALAHEWSSGYSGYSKSETQAKLDNWTTGPTTCEHFKKLGPHCNGCTRSVKSPIQLGYTLDTKPTVIETVNEEGEREVVAEINWPEGFSWTGGEMIVSSVGDDGVVIRDAFCKTLFYPLTRVRIEDGTWGLQILANHGTRNERTFVIPSKSISDPKTLASMLAEYEVLTVGKNGKKNAADLLQAFVLTYQHTGVETITYPNFGWHGEEFVLGSTKLSKDGSTEILPGHSIDGDMAKMHECGGDLNTWVDLVDTVYNRRGAEAYQFVICAALASPMVEWTSSNVWHGIPIALTGGPGEGKTSAMSVACSLYGHPDRFLVNAGENGMTLNAAIGRLAAMRNLPVIMDEMTGRSKEDVSGLLYALSNGRSKIRMSADGSPHPLNDGRWNMLSFISGNEEFSEKLAGLTKHVAAATELRVFDIKIPEGYSEVFSGVNAKDIVEQQILSKHYGHAGRKWLNFLIKNREGVHSLLNKELARWSPRNQVESQERFYHNALIHVYVAAKLAKKLGLIRFDVEQLYQWGRAQIEAMRVGRTAVEVTSEDHLAKFLSDIHGRTIVTKHFGDKRYGVVEPVPEALLQNAKFSPVARQATVDKKFLVSAPAFNEWCRDNNISPAWMRDELIAEGVLVTRNGEYSRRESLGKGTTLPLAHVRVYEFDYAKVTGAEAVPGAGGKVIQMPGRSDPEVTDVEEAK